MLPRTALIQIQRSMYAKLKEHASSMFGGLPAELKQYFQEYQREFQSFTELSTKKELLLEVLKSQIVLLGDYHTLSQAQRTVIRILRDSVRVLNRQKRKIILALEMLTPEHDAWVQAFLKGSLSEREFLERIGFKENWGFPWENYRALFDFAKENGIEIQGINRSTHKGRGNLKTRDQFAAQRISEILKKNRSSIVFVLIGDLHLAQKHLPLELKQIFKSKKEKPRILIIHQNLEKLYWKLVERGLEGFIDVVKISQNNFCVMNTPPWVKLKSHLNWAELIAETGSLPPLETAAQAFHEMDYTHEVQELAQVIAKFLGLTLPALDNFQIYGPLDTDLLNLKQGESGAEESKLAKLNQQYARVFKSYFVPGSNFIFLNSLSLNHVAAQSSLYLHSKLSGFTEIFENPNRDFYRFIWIEALGFLGAKIINPKRKCYGYLDLRKHVSKMKAKKNDDNKQSARLALLHLEWERRRSQGNTETAFLLPLSTEKNLIYYKTAKILGHLLGNSIYQGMVDARIPQSEVRALFYYPLPSPEVAKQLYWKWTQRLDLFSYRESVNWERL
jgi:uncharacterized iron-regulated protein